ncbi:MAG: alkaline phosphatase D family protein [Bryobacteraceae bacterium]|nr:alkaline phosphatase D family protein [Bryobacteraceae bacterium]
MIARRSLLFAGAAAAFAQSPRPVVTGVQTGDPLTDRILLWARADRPSRLLVDYNGRSVRAPFALDVSDYTARLDLTGLPPGSEVRYTVRFESLGDASLSEPVEGRARTAPAAKADIRFVWTGDTAGQGYGINPEWGGMRIYETMRRDQPHFLLHSGDTIYADNPIPPEIKLPDGSVWKNLTTPEKSKVAETLDEFRGNYRYNLLDENIRRFNREVPQIWQWDDHEVSNNWSPSLDLAANPRYKDKRLGLLIANATRAFLEYAPIRFDPADEQRVYRHIPYGPLLDVFVIDMRSYRGPNTHNRQSAESNETVYLDKPQLDWLEQGLARSKATWKVIASDMPIGLVVGDGKDKEGRPRFENSANGDGPPLGRELEIARVLRAIRQRRIRNVVWLTADTHYTAAHYYDPAKAQFKDFDPFWEFVSGPANAGTFGPNATDNTFGIDVQFFKAPPQGQVNLPPSAGYQFYGLVEIDGRSEQMKVTLKDVAGASLYSKILSPQR